MVRLLGRSKQDVSRGRDAARDRNSGAGFPGSSSAYIEPEVIEVSPPSADQTSKSKAKSLKRKEIYVVKSELLCDYLKFEINCLFKFAKLIELFAFKTVTGILVMYGFRLVNQQRLKHLSSAGII
ncbi:hypothetical protein LXL04_023661 [Taraxacum kok-saghyz]